VIPAAVAPRAVAVVAAVVAEVAVAAAVAGEVADELKTTFPIFFFLN